MRAETEARGKVRSFARSFVGADAPSRAEEFKCRPSQRRSGRDRWTRCVTEMGFRSAWMGQVNYRHSLARRGVWLETDLDHVRWASQFIGVLWKQETLTLESATVQCMLVEAFLR